MQIGRIRSVSSAYAAGFQPAPPVEGAIIVNAGDFLMRCAYRWLKRIRVLIHTYKGQTI